MSYSQIKQNTDINIDPIIKKSIQSYSNLFKENDKEKLFNFLYHNMYELNCIENTYKWFKDIDNKEVIDPYNKLIKIKKQIINDKVFQSKIKELYDYYKESPEKQSYLKQYLKEDISPTLKNININILEIKKLYNTNINIPNNVLSYLKQNKITTEINIFNYHDIIYPIKNKEIKSILYKNVYLLIDSYIENFIYILLNKKIYSKELGFDNYIDYIFNKSPDLFNLLKHDDFLPSLSYLIKFIIETINKNDSCIFDIINEQTKIKNNQISFDELSHILYKYTKLCNDILFDPLKTFNNVLALICQFLKLEFKQIKSELHLSYHINQYNKTIGEINFLVKKSTKTYIQYYRFNNRIYDKNKNKCSPVITNIILNYNNYYISFSDFLNIVNNCISIIFYTLQKTDYGNLNTNYFMYFSSIIKTYLFTQDNLLKINNVLTNDQIIMIYNYFNIQSNYLMKYRCLYILFYIFSYSNDEFLQQCKDIILSSNKGKLNVNTTECINQMTNKNISKQLSSLVKEHFHEMFKSLMIYPTLYINHNINDFHPIIWKDFILENINDTIINSLISELFGIQFIIMYQKKRDMIDDLLKMLENPNDYSFNYELRLKNFETYINQLHNWNLQHDENIDSTVALLNDMMILKKDE